MSVWDLYTTRITNSGITKRDEHLRREKATLTRQMQNSLTFYTVQIDGVDQNVSIINSDNLDEKVLHTLPDETIDCGSLVFWKNNYWIVTETDANQEVYTRAKLQQCNYLLKWVEVTNGSPVVVQQWCVIEDGTKYMSGIYADRDFIVERGDMRVALILPRNESTIRLSRTNRFLIDEAGSGEMLSFDLTKPLKVGHVYNGKGVLKFVLSESNSTDYDNFELGVADYYKYFPDNDHPALPGSAVQNGSGVWL